MSWSLTARTNCKTAPRSSRGRAPAARRVAIRALRQTIRIRLLLRPPGDLRDESFAAVYSAARRYHIADGWRHPGGAGGLPPVACLRTAAGRLSDHSSADVLSRR